MNQIVINRLIGGAVLMFVGAFFVPAILSPKQNNLHHSSTSVDVMNTSQQTGVVELTSSAQNTSVAEEISLPKVQGISLESSSLSAEPKTEATTVVEIGASAQKSSVKQPPKQLTAVSLTSIENTVDESATSKKAAPKPAAPKKQSWLQLGSFTEQRNAKGLVTELKAARYPVRVETAKVNGAPFIRVLVGPFSDEKAAEKMSQKLSAKGYTPSVYH